MKRIVEKGQVFGELTAVAISHMRGAMQMWACQCSCGNTKVIRKYDLLNGKSTSCGCVHKKMVSALAKSRRKYKIPEPGDRFTRLVVVSALGNKRYELLCDCGNKHEASENALTTGAVKSCGCINRDILVARNTTHGLAHTPEMQHMWGAARRARKLQATPGWDVDKTKKVFMSLSKRAKLIKKDTGVQYHVDHIVPLTGKRDGEQVVCGLHVWYNLQLIPGADNCSKSCYEWPDM